MAGEYTTRAVDYDKLNEDKCYKWECRDIFQRIAEHKKSGGRALLDIGCGTGGHLRYLQRHFDCTGIDLHNEMLAVARKKLGRRVRLVQADMSAFNLKSQFDVIICLYSVLNHSKDYSVLSRTIRNMYRHLKPGGVAIIEPYYTSKVYRNFSGKAKKKGLLMTEIGKWLRIMRTAGFKVRYFYRGLHFSAKGMFILRK